MKVSPLGALIALSILGITIELVESKSKKAALVLSVVLLLSMITFNAFDFQQQIARIIAYANATPPKKTPSTAAPKR